MSMLAEKKRKQKWSLNPRGKDWSQDNNKFGQKLLEKMGWSQGRGLGAKEDGRIEHVKVAYKNDSQGMGYKESDNQWTEHESNFAALLEALGGGSPKDTEIKLSSLEAKSENTKARVHYRKFTRGKDLSRYSEKDLANIFGKKSLKEVKPAKHKLKVVDQEINEHIEEGKNFLNAGLISEYFKKKLPNFGITNGYMVGNNGVLKKAHHSESETNENPIIEERETFEKLHESESESELRPNFGFGFKENKISENIFSETETKDSKIKSSFVSYIGQDYIDKDVSPKKRKNKKKRIILDDDPPKLEYIPAKKKKLAVVAQTEGNSKKKKKDNQKKKAVDDTGLSNPAFDPLYFSPIKIEKHRLEPIEESINEPFNDTSDSIGQVAEDFEVQVQIVNEVTPISKKKKKGKDKATEMDVSSEGEDLSLSLNRSQPVREFCERELQSKRKKKSKCNVQSIQEMDVSSLNSTIESSLDNDISKRQRKKLKTSSESLPDIEEDITSSKPKKHTSKKDQEGIDNPLFNISVDIDNSFADIDSTNVPKIKGKSRKRHKNKENFCAENLVFIEEDSANFQDIMNEEYEVKRKGKSKKKDKRDKEDSRGLDNPALNLNDTMEESCDLMLNVVATLVENNQEKSFTESTLNIKKVKGVARRKSVRFSDVTRERLIPTKEEIDNEALDDRREILEVQGILNDSSDLTYIDKFIEKKKAKKRNKGLDNIAFDEQSNSIEENIKSITKTLDTFQAEIENDINEAKQKTVEIDDIMVGEVGNPEGTNEKLSDGTVKLKFKHAHFQKTAKYIEALTGAKKSYKHLIKGDIVMDFKETNLHEIQGYAVAGNSSAVA